MDEKLKPCPWCESTDAHHQSDYGDESQFVCAVCDTRGPMKRSYAEAITAWNTRTPSRNDVLEEAAMIADAKVQYAAQHPNNPLVQAEGVARDIATAIRARKDQTDAN